MASVVPAFSCPLMETRYVNQPCELPTYPIEKLHDTEWRVTFSQQPASTWGHSPTAQEKLNPANNHVSSLEVDSSPVKFSHDHTPSSHLSYSLVWDPEPEDLMSRTEIPNSQKLSTNDCLLC
jgi:hypothetical protein